ncbi:MAG: Type 1 glutamine amidotransferase-like domain-containing protein [Patescibacteria group bacterium]
MKLLLTSTGIVNPSLTKAFFDLVGKKPEDTSLVYIPTAAMSEPGDKSWVIEDLVHIKNLGLKQIEIADISALPKEVWKPRFESADALFFEGGNIYYLMHWIQQSGLAELLPELLKTKVWVGVSAGSMVLSPTLDLKVSQELYVEDLDQTADGHALNFVNFYVLPHLNSQYFKKLTLENIEEVIKNSTYKQYALDDESGIKVDGDSIEIISEGEWKGWN